VYLTAPTHPVLVSACLLGLPVRYNGCGLEFPHVTALAEKVCLVPVCPEILGGLGIPRAACRFQGGDGRTVLAGKAKIVNTRGEDKTTAFVQGAEHTAHIFKLVSASFAVFKEGSPSCGVHRVDIEGIKQPGTGVTAALLQDKGCTLLTELNDLTDIAPQS
jgi:uncharacterized protein YbbK (DUF523 family)